MRVLHLVGSPVSEELAELSRLYAADCLAATADPARYEAHVAHVEPGGAWSFPVSLLRPALADATRMPLAEALRRIADLRIAVALPQMFCRPGMTAYRALLDVAGIPYLGNPPGAMALGADKPRARAVVAAAGVPVPEGEVVRRGGRASLPPPVVVKPADSDNSLGVSLVRSAADYPAAIDGALAHADEALVEAYVPAGREVRCATLERSGRIEVLPLEEYDLSGSPVRRYEDKLARSADGGLGLVAKDAAHAWILPAADPLADVVGPLAVRAHRALGCRQYGLFDFRIDPAGRPWWLEAGLYCSFARQSVIVTMAEAAGIPLTALFADAIDDLLADRLGDPGSG